MSASYLFLDSAQIPLHIYIYTGATHQLMHDLKKAFTSSTFKPKAL